MYILTRTYKHILHRFTARHTNSIQLTVCVCIHIYIYIYIYIYSTPPGLVIHQFWCKSCDSAPDPIHPRFSTSLKDYSVCVYVYTLNPSMCAELQQNNMLAHMFRAMRAVSMPYATRVLKLNPPGKPIEINRFNRFNSPISCNRAVGLKTEDGRCPGKVFCEIFNVQPERLIACNRHIALIRLGFALMHWQVSASIRMPT